MDVFEKDVLEYIRKYHMFDGISHCVCGVSGGADSVSLLTVLARHRAELGIDIHVVHINHMIRGEAAYGDVRMLAEQAGQTWRRPDAMQDMMHLTGCVQICG